jgi:hypothetical protein
MQIKSPSAPDGRTSGFDSHLACADARYPTPPDLMRSGRDIRAIASKIKGGMDFIYGGARYDRIPFVPPFLAEVSQQGSASALAHGDDAV